MSKNRGKTSADPTVGGRSKADIREVLAARNPKLLADLDAQFAEMQTPRAKAAAFAAFNATPEEIGQAAVKAAKAKTSA